MGSRKVQVYIVVPRGGSAHSPASRLIRGSLKDVETLLRGEVEIRVATAEEAHAMSETTIEDATQEPGG